MPLPSELPFRWRHSPDAPLTVSAAAFARIVAEHKLTPTKSGGYLWAFLPTEDGYDTCRTFDDWKSVPVTVAATANPAAGSNPATVTVPAGKRWLLMSIYNQLVTSADVANRRALLTVTDGTNTINRPRAGADQTASNTIDYSFAPQLYTTTTLAVNMMVGMQEFDLTAGSTIALSYINIQAADDAGAMVYAYKEVSV